MDKSSDCWVADCESFSLDIWKLLPLVKLGIAAIPMALTLVRKLYNGYLREPMSNKSLKKKLMIFVVFVPYVTFSIITAMFFGCFLGASVYAHTASRLGALAICATFVTVFRVRLYI